jgi:deoxyadenosine/deoxycytidine kinase
MFAGPSGFGKTTLAKWLSNETSIPFISGSVSDLLPKTKDMPHKDMLKRDIKELYEEDFQILNLRNHLFKNQDLYISDRSYLDSAAYFIHKQASEIPACEIEHYIGLCQMLLAQQCDLLIFLNFVPELVDKWVTEDNNKRITNNYFQIQISSTMYTALKLMGFESSHHIWETEDKISLKSPLLSLLRSKKPLRYGVEMGTIYSIYGEIHVMIINEPNLDIRKSLLTNILI